MANESIQLNNTFCKELLDIITINLGLGAYLKLQDCEIINSSKSERGFCSIINERYPGSCNCDFSLMDENLHLCPAGLWLRIIPIILEGEKVGTICIGYRKIKGRELESHDQLLKFLEDQLASNDERYYLVDLLNKTESVNQTSFNVDSIKKYSHLLETYLLIEKFRAEESEKRVNDLKALAMNLSHQFLLPIQAILGNAENAIDEYTKLNKICQREEILEMLKEIFLEIRKLSYSAQNLRNWPVTEIDIYRYDFIKKPIYPTIAEAVKLFQAEASTRGITIRDPISKNGPFPNLEISEEHIRRVFFNILHNAVKYSFDGNKNNHRYIEIIGNYSGEYYCIETSNFGLGILPEEKELIFQTGYRGKLARDRRRFGSGLGLASVKKIVEDHGGKVTVDSKKIELSEGSSKLTSPYKTSISICLPISRTKN